MSDRGDTPFRLWGYGHSMQALLMSSRGLVIRDGNNRILIPRANVARFRYELNALLDEQDQVQAGC